MSAQQLHALPPSKRQTGKFAPVSWSNTRAAHSIVLQRANPSRRNSMLTRTIFPKPQPTRRREAIAGYAECVVTVTRYLEDPSPIGDLPDDPGSRPGMNPSRLEESVQWPQ
jgi:hypothetical protein